jgi:3'-phosphoadenosine 5'-phosphosulfate (PAPS) 3'-phosphatase
LSIRSTEESTGLPEDAHRYARELDAAIAAALAGGAIVKDFYDRAAAATYQKGDGSLVTDADIAADRVIREVLREWFPEDAILTEEGEDDPRRLQQARCWIVDPVDGTEQFIARTGEFDVLVALVEDGRPVAVAGYQPTTATLVTATPGGGAWVRVGEDEPQRVSHDPITGQLRIATSKWFGAPGNAAIMQGVAERLHLPNGSVVVTGFTPRMFLSPRAFDVMVGVRDGEGQDMASEWDFAVADLVISEAGGKVSDLNSRPYRYNKPVPKNVGGLVAAVDPATHALVLQAVRSERESAATP